MVYNIWVRTYNLLTQGNYFSTFTSIKLVLKIDNFSSINEIWKEYLLIIILFKDIYSKIWFFFSMILTSQFFCILSGFICSITSVFWIAEKVKNRWAACNTRVVSTNKSYVWRRPYDNLIVFCVYPAITFCSRRIASINIHRLKKFCLIGILLVKY